MKFLVTGATGFIGAAFCQTLKDHPEHTVYGVARSPNATFPLGIKPVIAASLIELAEHPVLAEVDAVIHLAARVHQMRDTAVDPLREFRAVNTEATKRLAIAAAKAGVRRFVYLSSIKVNGGEQSEAYTERSDPNPQDPYGISKWEAECALQTVAAQTGLEVVCLRPPLVYGPGVKANFAQLMRLVESGIPLPFGNVENRRSLIYVGNLVDAIVTCAIHPAAAGETFLVSDDTDLSTGGLIRSLAQSMHKPVRLFSVSPVLLSSFAQLLGKTAAVDRVLGSLVLDSSKIRQTLNWQPPFTLADGLSQTVSGHCSTH